MLHSIIATILAALTIEAVLGRGTWWNYVGDPTRSPSELPTWYESALFAFF